MAKTTRMIKLVNCARKVKLKPRARTRIKAVTRIVELIGVFVRGFTLERQSGSQSFLLKLNRMRAPMIIWTRRPLTIANRPMKVIMMGDEPVFCV